MQRSVGRCELSHEPSLVMWKVFFRPAPFGVVSNWRQPSALMTQTHLVALT